LRGVIGKRLLLLLLALLTMSGVGKNS